MKHIDNLKTMIKHPILAKIEILTRVNSFLHPSTTNREKQILAYLTKYICPPINSTVNPKITSKKIYVQSDKTVWVYWNNGFDKAPDIVKKCILSTKAISKQMNWDFVLLDSSNLYEYIELPEYIETLHNNGKIKEALYSDLLRISILAEYGGIWADATCYFSDVISSAIFNSKFFVFQTPLFGNDSHINCSNWFIYAKHDSKIIAKVKNALYRYWTDNNFLIYYFIFHLFVYLIIKYDEECKKEWDKMLWMSNMPPHLLQYSFNKSFSSVQLKHILESSFVHKLTYRGLNLSDTNTILNRFLDNDARITEKEDIK